VNLIVLIGPTAVGKTELSLRLASSMKCPIFNCDSRQLYRDMPIGTASPTPEQLHRAHHYFVGILSPDEYYSAACYEAEVLRLMEELRPIHQNVILSGGSMMYVDAVCKGIDDIPTVSDEVRVRMKQRLNQEGLENLLVELKDKDPAYYDIVDKKNPKRVVHALEICCMSGMPYSSFRTQKIKKRPFNILKIGLRRERSDLFDRINHRVDEMMSQGLLDEVRRLKPYRDENALNTVGYKELFRYLDGEWPLEMAVERIKKNTRVYAKKQMTWFQHDRDIHWFHPDEYEAVWHLIETWKGKTHERESD